MCLKYYHECDKTDSEYLWTIFVSMTPKRLGQELRNFQIHQQFVMYIMP